MRSSSRPFIWMGWCCSVLWLVQALLHGVAEVRAASQTESQTEASPSALVGGPFPVRSLSPIQLLFFQFTPERAVPGPRGTWQMRFDLVEANILGRDQRQEDLFLFDFELTRANLALQYGVFDRLAVELEVPFLYTWKGFLDDFIKGFERATGFRREIRFERPQHLFSDVLQKDGRAVLKGTSGAVGIGDIAISTKALLRDESRWSPAIAARAALKLPTGDEDRALGSGEVDVGLGLSMEKTLGSTRIYFNAGLTIPTGEPFAGTGIESLPMFSAFLTGEYRLTERLSLPVQVNGVSPPVRNTGLDIDHASFEILAGVSWAIPGYPVVWQAGLMEDWNDTNRTADFAVFTSWSLFFGRPSAASQCCKELTK